MNGPKLLRRYLELTGLTQQDFAAQAKVSTASVSLWLAGKSRPGGSSALSIQGATDGRVPFTAWFPASKRPTLNKPNQDGTRQPPKRRVAA